MRVHVNIMMLNSIFVYAIRIVLYKLSAEYIIAKLLAYSIRNDTRKIPSDYGKCHVKHDMTILLT